MSEKQIKRDIMGKQKQYGGLTEGERERQGGRETTDIRTERKRESKKGTQKDRNGNRPTTDAERNGRGRHIKI